MKYVLTLVFVLMMGVNAHATGNQAVVQRVVSGCNQAVVQRVVVPQQRFVQRVVVPQRRFVQQVVVEQPVFVRQRAAVVVQQNRGLVSRIVDPFGLFTNRAAIIIR